MTKKKRIPDYLVAGDSDTTVFLLHGGYGSKAYWGTFIERLVKQGYRAVAWDAPGYGISPLPSPYTIETLVESFGWLLAREGTATNVLFGHSAGGLIAPKACQIFPDRIAGLVLSATVESLGHMEKPFQEEFIRERIAPLDQGKSLEQIARPLLQTMIAPQSSGPAVDLVIDVSASTPEDTFRATIRAIVEYDARTVLPDVNAPALCIAGENDPVGAPKAMANLAATLPAGEYACVQSAGHYAWAEQPEQFDTILFDFLQNHRLLP